MNTTAPVGTALTVATAPGCTPRLLRLPATAETHSAYVSAGGYAPLDNAEALLAEVEFSSLSFMEFGFAPNFRRRAEAGTLAYREHT